MSDNHDKWNKVSDEIWPPILKIKTFPLPINLCSKFGFKIFVKVESLVFEKITFAI